MAGFGENLRRERELRGISLQEISSTTKISVRSLELLEAEEFSKLPGGIFIRSFIRSYANYLGLDEEQVMAEYQLVAPPQGNEDFSRLGVTGTSAKKSRAPVLPWVIAALLLFGGYIIFRYAHRAADAPLSFGSPPPVSKTVSASARAAAASPAAQRPAVLAVPQEQTPSTPHASATAAGAPPVTTPNANTAQKAAGASNPTAAATAATPPGSPGAGLTLQVAATEQAWVSVKADGKTVLEQVMKPNDVHTLTAKNSFDVTTGNAEGTLLTLDGTTLGPLGRRGEVKVLHLTLESLKSSNSQ